MFDSLGNLWVGDNFTVGWQDAFWQGNATKFNPNGKPLSPITTGFAGGGTFGAAVDAKDNAWFSSYGSKSIAVFDKNGTTLTPPEGITFDGQLGLMQGIIATPNGDVWALGVSKRQLLHFPKGDWTRGRIVCEGDSTSGDVWVMNNWQDIDSCYRNASEALSTRCGGQGVVIFFGMAKPVRAPQIGPAQPL
jgi:hypothetical protein